MQTRREKMEIEDPIEVENKIYMIRGKKVMLDSDLARLYGVSTKSLNLAVKRNPKRFPSDFMYPLSRQEVANLRFQIETSKPETIENTGVTILRSQIVTSKPGRGGRRYLTYAFAEQGIAMLSTVLNSERAIQVNIQIMRAFIRLKELVASNELLRQKIEEMEKKYDQQFQIVFEAIKKLIEPSPEESRPERRIGFNTGKAGKILVGMVKQK